MQFGMKLIAPLWILALSAGVIQAQESVPDIQDSTNNVLAALGVSAVPAMIPEVVVNGDLIAIIGDAMVSGKSNDYINALVMEAHSEGQIAVPDSMTDGKGDIDTAAMLAAVVTAAIAAQPAQEAPEMAALETGAGDDGNEAITGRTHLVKSGDTLNFLAKHYYGASGTYQQIMAANPDISNANLISIGMVLRIPE